MEGPSVITVTAEGHKALVESVEHWKRLETGCRMEGEEIGQSDCALCGLFRRRARRLKGPCDDCPVAQATYMRFCKDSPYWEAHRIAAQPLKTGDCSDFDLDSTAFRAAAAKEREFLEDLLARAIIQEEVKETNDDISETEAEPNGHNSSAA